MTRLEKKMKVLVFPFGRESYLTKSQHWGGEVAQEVKEVEALFEKSRFWYYACGNQEVYEVSEEGMELYEKLKPKLQEFLSSHTEKVKYEMARAVTTW